MNPDANIRIVAEKAGVSTAAVSRVLNKKPNVSEAMKSKVIKACLELDYRPNPNIQDLIRKGRSGTTRNLAYVSIFRDISYPMYAQNLDGIEEASRTFNYNLSLTRLSGEEKSLYDLPPLLRDGRADGLLLTGSLNEQIVSILKSCGKPIVILGSYSDAICGDLPKVALDFGTTLFKMVRELKNSGKKRIAFFNNVKYSNYSADLAFEAYKKALTANGFNFDADLVFWEDGSANRPPALLQKAFSSAPIPFDGIICLNYTCATLASHFVFAHQKLPEEVLLATLWPFPHFPLPVPTIYFSYAFKSIALKGTTMLIDTLSGGDSLLGQKIELPSQIMNRSSEFSNNEEISYAL